MKDVPDWTTQHQTADQFENHLVRVPCGECPYNDECEEEYPDCPYGYDERNSR